MEPIVSVVVVSDYASGETRAWDDLRAALAALTRQDFEVPAEFLLVENCGLERQIPADVRAMLPGLRIVASPGTTSYDLKNDGARAASAEIVAFLDADCVPAPGWLQSLVDCFRDHPDADVVSGRTLYPGQGILARILAVIDRGYVDHGHRATTRYVSINNAGFRRSLLLRHPLPNDVGPFGARLHSEAIRRNGGRFLFEPAMLVHHAFDGWAMEKDIRRNMGYEAIAVRKVDPRIRFAWLTRLGHLSIPLIVGYRTLLSWSRCVRLGRHYGVASYELPLAFGLAVVVHAMEVPGMIMANRGRTIEMTAYR